MRSTSNSMSFALIAVAAIAFDGAIAQATVARSTRASSGPRPAARVHVAAPANPVPIAETSAPAPARDSAMTLHGGQEGTVFRSLTVEGEDRIHYEVARPDLKLAVNPDDAPGLDWGTARDVLDRTVPDVMSPLLVVSSREPSPFTARPWLSHFAAGAVARFRPAVEGVARWKLTVANAGGEAVATFQGSGDPPSEIPWDGRSASGAPVTPGATYSYVFEATDKAGNRRHFVGDGFRVAAFRIMSDAATTLVFAGTEMSPPRDRAASLAAAERPSPVILEAASWLDQSAATQPIAIMAVAHSADEASTLAQRVRRQIAPLLMGDPARVRVDSRAATDAPEGGAVTIVCGRAGSAGALKR